jgi:hypothetical protein
VGKAVDGKPFEHDHLERIYVEDTSARHGRETKLLEATRGLPERIHR